MTVKVDRELCAVCSLCILICQEDAIMGWEYPKIDYEKCTECKRCIVYCPTGAMGEEDEG